MHLLKSVSSWNFILVIFLISFSPSILLGRLCLTKICHAQLPTAYILGVNDQGAIVNSSRVDLSLWLDSGHHCCWWVVQLIPFNSQSCIIPVPLVVVFPNGSCICWNLDQNIPSHLCLLLTFLLLQNSTIAVLFF